MKELKSGDSLDFVVGDKTLTLEPLPFGNIKKILHMVQDLAKEKGLSNLVSVPDIIDNYLMRIIPLLFAKGRYDFLGDEWIQDNFTIPTMRKMIEAAIVINGLQDFFDKAAAKMQKIKSSPIPDSDETQKTPLEKDGSTIPSDSVTDGDLKTLTS